MAGLWRTARGARYICNTEMVNEYFGIAIVLLDSLTILAFARIVKDVRDVSHIENSLRG
jgi:hypothetical protein